MDKVNLESVRDIIILSFSSDENGIRFDTDRVLNKGFSEAEIVEAERVILSGPTLTLKTIQIISDIKFITPEMAVINPWIYYMEPVGLILFIHRERFFSTYLFEEDLIVEVYKKNNIAFLLDYLDKNPQCDAYGNDI
jgi:hypothetical protein